MDALAKKVASVLALGTLMVMLDLTVTVVAIPRLAESFDSPLSTVQWTTTAYTLALVAVMPTSAGTIRRFGAKRVYVTALTTFVVGSALAGLAWNIQSLILFRAVQGFGGGFLQPVGMTIALGLVDERHRGQLMGWLGIPLLVGPVLGPTTGGLLVDHVGWRSLFLLNPGRRGRNRSGPQALSALCRRRDGDPGLVGAALPRTGSRPAGLRPRSGRRRR
ncbi:MFS transporter [Gordonia amicalis]|uniref:MFS transporter n=1 Tax=Gordonia amicalis TaxID=89053 RepID=UPI0002A644CA|nr:MFS transporter [Gordonia amicalis]MDV7173096.1 MFS transporter [Gordonia amicalis]GAC55014.1 hypothetical protein GOAMI_41_00490 [Gordonia amicalis NBRC 100051 = JCM 11271]